MDKYNFIYLLSMSKFVPMQLRLVCVYIKHL